MSSDNTDHQDMDVVMDDNSGDGQQPQPFVDQMLPSVVKSHLPPHLQPRGGRPANRNPQQVLKDSTVTANTAGAVATTPAVVKRRQASKWFNSPTDAFLSPCTQKLMKPKHDNQQVIQPLDFDDDRKHQSVVSGAQGVVDAENAMH